MAVLMGTWELLRVAFPMAKALVPVHRLVLTLLYRMLVLRLELLVTARRMALGTAGVALVPADMLIDVIDPIVTSGVQVLSMARHRVWAIGIMALRWGPLLLEPMGKPLLGTPLLTIAYPEVLETLAAVTGMQRPGFLRQSGRLVNRQHRHLPILFLPVPNSEGFLFVEKALLHLPDPLPLTVALILSYESLDNVASQLPTLVPLTELARAPDPLRCKATDPLLPQTWQQALFLPRIAILTEFVLVRFS